MDDLNALSLYDGMSCGQIALIMAGINYKNYYSSEIDKRKIKLTQHNFPDTIQLGDVRKLTKYPKNINLLIGGSPCQGFSVNGKKLNFDDPRSELLIEFIRIRDEINPKDWLLENVASMSHDIKLLIDEIMGVEGIYINSNLFSAQNRKRIYWTNIKFNLPKQESNLKIKDYLESKASFKFCTNEFIERQKIRITETDGVITLNPRKPNGKQTFQQERIYDSKGRMPCLTTLGRYIIKDDKDRLRYLTVREQARLQTIPDEYDFSVVTDSVAGAAIGNGWSIDTIVNIFNNIID